METQAKAVVLAAKAAWKHKATGIAVTTLAMAAGLKR